MRHHLVRIGLLGQIGKFRSTDAIVFPRASRVVCRTARGLEFGEVLSPARWHDPHVTTTPIDPLVLSEVDGELLRGMTPEDELLKERLDRHRDEAFHACQQQLTNCVTAANLIDVEVLLDGQSVYFYFLGPVSPQVTEITQQLAETFEAKSNIRQFSETLINGCGPDCGTAEGGGGGCGTGNCAGCAAVDACKNSQ